MNLQEILPDIFRIVVPFEDIYTTVFVIRTEEGFAVLDTATFDADMDNYLFPVLESLDVTQETLKYVIISHAHRDHAGGLGRFLEKYPETTVLARSEALQEKYKAFSVSVPEDGDVVLGCLRVVTIPGHAPDCIAIYDGRSRTLLSADCLQLYGIYGCGKWGSNIRFPQAYFPAIKKVRAMDVENIVAAHKFHPCDYAAFGREQAAWYLRECEIPLERIAEDIRSHPEWDDAQIAENYTNSNQLPTLARVIVTAVREAMDAGTVPELKR